MEGFEVSSATVERDEPRLLLTLPCHAYDVSDRRVGDIVKAGILISNREVGTMALRAEISLLRLACTNGMTAADMAITRIRHIHVNRVEFLARLRDTVARAGQVRMWRWRRRSSWRSISRDIERFLTLPCSAWSRGGLSSECYAPCLPTGRPPS